MTGFFSPLRRVTHLTSLQKSAVFKINKPFISVSSSKLQKQNPKKDSPKNLNKITFSSRMQSTLANGFSKLILAGCGWQIGAESGDDAGCKEHNLHFMFWTGFGDGLGVGFGHIAYKSVYYSAIKFSNYAFNTNLEVPDIKKEAVTALQLGTASFGSGTAWQPIVDLLKYYEFGYYSTTVMTGLACGTIFLGGMRLGRYVYPMILGDQVIAKPNKENLKDDASLSLIGIAGASGMFVSTDTSFKENPLKGVFGIDEAHAHTKNVLTAGASTVTGFIAAQTVQNLFLSVKDKFKKAPLVDEVVSKGFRK